MFRSAFSLMAVGNCAAASENGAVVSACSLWNNIAGWFSHNLEGLLLFAICFVSSIPIAIFCSWIIRAVVRGVLKKSKRDERKIADSLNKPIIFAGAITGFVFGIRSLAISAGALNVINRVYYVIIVVLVAWAVLRMLSVVRVLLQEVAKKTENVYDDLLVSLIYPVVKGLIWIFVVFFIAENIFDFKVTTLVAGAGVAAMAIAFAAQNTIANIFGALALIFDRPFTIGDMISFNGKRGSVIAIGLRSTTLRTLDGTVWNVPNKEVAEASIENITGRPNIKWSCNIDLVYSTTPAQILRAKAIITEILLASPLTDAVNSPPAVWFSECAESSLRISVVNRFQTTDWAAFCAQREIVQLKILEKFAEEKLEMAYHTQTIHLVGEK